MVLATDASRIKLRSVFRFHSLPLRLLGLGLPLTILLGTLLALLFFGEFSIWTAAILAVILAPTDLSLGASVVESPKVPVRIRQALNIEGGLNDGIAMPFLVMFISLALSQEFGLGSGAFLQLILAQIGLGTLAGALLGYLGARYIEWAYKRDWMSAGFLKICWLALVLLTFGAAEFIGGNGFIAAFTFGLVSGNSLLQQQSDSLYEYAEVENSALMLATYMVFGLVMLRPALQTLSWPIVLYALLSLTLVRILPVAISLIGSKLQPVSVLFLGWFGPRGIASLLYVLTVLAVEDLEGIDTIYTVTMITVFLSIILHGLTATPVSNWYGKRMAQMDSQGAAEVENKPVPELPVRNPRMAAVSPPKSA